ncbi:ABC transporter substrate-binding protein [Sorangium sp. So ce1099]|uniref:ABC transporter substrate-binding protein n=1 Tax=Sorangium sp. So ce1099 TaxID=3133331 RepID=UPI003F622859
MRFLDDLRTSGGLMSAATALLACTGLLLGCEEGSQPKADVASPAEQARSGQAKADQGKAAPAGAEQIKIGVIATMTGPLASLGEEGMRGVDLAFDEFGGAIAGKKIVLVKESSDATPNVARDAARKLLEQEKVDFIVGPLSGDEGLAIRDLAKSHPERVFVNGSAAAQDITLRDQAPNFYRFSPDGAQWMTGVGSYAFKEKGYKRVATLAEDYSYPYTLVGGFMAEFCHVGGRVPKKLWVPLGTKDYSSVISSLPKDIDAIYVALGGADALTFLKQYKQFGGKAPLIGGSSTVDQMVLDSKGAVAEHLVGTVSGVPIADDNPSETWQSFVKAYRAKFPDGYKFPSGTLYSYYTNMKAALLALKQVNGDLSNNQEKLKDALSKLEFESPNGKVKLDKNRNAISDSYLTVVEKKEDGTLYKRLLKVIPEVNQTMKLPEDEFLKLGSFNRDNPSCP